MEQCTREALERSIAHWKENAQVEQPMEGDVSMRACALCELFFDLHAASHCRGCPVAEATGKTHCKGTPYVQAEIERWEGTVEAFRKAAQAEVEFLQSLLPESSK